MHFVYEKECGRYYCAEVPRHSGWLGFHVKELRAYPTKELALAVCASLNRNIKVNKDGYYCIYEPFYCEYSDSYHIAKTLYYKKRK